MSLFVDTERGRSYDLLPEMWAIDDELNVSQKEYDEMCKTLENEVLYFKQGTFIRQVLSPALLQSQQGYSTCVLGIVRFTVEHNNTLDVTYDTLNNDPICAQQKYALVWLSVSIPDTPRYIRTIDTFTNWVVELVANRSVENRYSHSLVIIAHTPERKAYVWDPHGSYSMPTNSSRLEIISRIRAYLPPLFKDFTFEWSPPSLCNFYGPQTYSRCGDCQLQSLQRILTQVRNPHLGVEDFKRLERSNEYILCNKRSLVFAVYVCLYCKALCSFNGKYRDVPSVLERIPAPVVEFIHSSDSFGYALVQQFIREHETSIRDIYKFEQFVPKTLYRVRETLPTDVYTYDYSPYYMWRLFVDTSTHPEEHNYQTFHRHMCKHGILYFFVENNARYLLSVSEYEQYVLDVLFARKLKVRWDVFVHLDLVCHPGRPATFNTMPVVRKANRLFDYLLGGEFYNVSVESSNTAQELLDDVKSVVKYSDIRDKDFFDSVCTRLYPVVQQLVSTQDPALYEVRNPELVLCTLLALNYVDLCEEYTSTYSRSSVDFVSVLVEVLTSSTYANCVFPDSLNWLLDNVQKDVQMVQKARARLLLIVPTTLTNVVDVQDVLRRYTLVQ